MSIKVLQRFLVFAAEFNIAPTPENLKKFKKLQDVQHV